MKIFKYSILCFILFSTSYTCIAQEKEHINLNFNDFTIKTKTKIKIKNANFAYHYLVKVYGCGGGAICGEISNLLSNKVIGLPNAYLIEDENGENEFLIEYHLDSSLIVISGIIADPDENEDKNGYRKRYYNFINDQLVLISSIKED
ncbi:hypothetical protein A9G45_10915 [Gilliamella sp. HK2]|jgi:hypothetical protein|uniref:hypothetical protein n=1 Tax=unclassified Gilliamella TaxID=2685620 RepID=UPI00080E9AFC|nr:hypothetical protein [Gilliamella apicola]OCG16467.1 hypothetical protein A9G47_10930 [Gilliamella apicola]OCG24631.1 hypothetical protein A9G46_08200 [Gilliamella apicola]OCG26409.1 hypothetical protein A9G45_10915 [Gilliamella apicola]